jgi:hypothetical protein
MNVFHALPGKILGFSLSSSEIFPDLAWHVYFVHILIACPVVSIVVDPLDLTIAKLAFCYYLSFSGALHHIKLVHTTEIPWAS